MGGAKDKHPKGPPSPFVKKKDGFTQLENALKSEFKDVTKLEALVTEYSLTTAYLSQSKRIKYLLGIASAWGDQAAVEWLVSATKPSWGSIQPALRNACENAHPDIARWRVAKIPPASLSVIQETFRDACKNEDLIFADWLLSELKADLEDPVDSFHNACKRGQTKAIMWLASKNPPSSDVISKGIDIACKKQHHHVVQLLMREFKSCLVNSAAAQIFCWACSEGAVEMAQDIATMISPSPDVVRKSLPLACNHGHENIVKWLLQSNFKSSFLIDGTGAAEEALILACSRGGSGSWLAIAKLIVPEFKFSEEATKTALRQAYKHKDLTLADFLTESFYLEQYAFVAAASSSGKLRVVQRAVEKFGTPTDDTSQLAFDQACFWTHEDVMWWIARTYKVDIKKTVTAVCQNEHLGQPVKACKWLAEQAPDSYDMRNYIFEVACSFGCLSVVQWLLDGPLSGVAIRAALQVAKDKGHHRVVKVVQRLPQARICATAAASTGVDSDDIATATAITAGGGEDSDTKETGSSNPSQVSSMGPGVEETASNKHTSDSNSVDSVSGSGSDDDDSEAEKIQEDAEQKHAATANSPRTDRNNNNTSDDDDRGGDVGPPRHKADSNNDESCSTSVAASGDDSSLPDWDYSAASPQHDDETMTQRRKSCDQAEEEGDHEDDGNADNDSHDRDDIDDDGERKGQTKRKRSTTTTTEKRSSSRDEPPHQQQQDATLASLHRDEETHHQQKRARATTTTSSDKVIPPQPQKTREQLEGNAAAGAAAANVEKETKRKRVQSKGGGCSIKSTQQQQQPPVAFSDGEEKEEEEEEEEISHRMKRGRANNARENGEEGSGHAAGALAVTEDQELKTRLVTMISTETERIRTSQSEVQVLGSKMIKLKKKHPNDSMSHFVFGILGQAIATRVAGSSSVDPAQLQCKPTEIWNAVTKRVEFLSQKMPHIGGKQNIWRQFSKDRLSQLLAVGEQLNSSMLGSKVDGVEKPLQLPTWVKSQQMWLKQIKQI